MDLYQLKNFYTLCLHQSYTIAAQKLLITQSAVSHSIKKLEDSIQKKLVDKNQKGFHLTKEGEILFYHCKKIMASIELAQDDLHNFTDTQTEVTIGSTLEFGSTVLIKELSRINLHGRLGKIHLNLSNNLLPLLLKDEVDFIIDCTLHHHKDIDIIQLFREEYVVICSPTYKRKFRLSKPVDLDNCPLLSLDIEGHWWHRFYYSVKDGSRPTLSNIIQINHIRGIINATLGDMGVGLVPQYTVIDELKSKKLIQLFPNIKISEDFFSIYVKKEKKSIKRIREIIRSIGASRVFL